MQTDIKKVAIYSRVSTEDQAERATIQNQIEFATKYCDLHELQVYDFYKDDGITGTLPLESRPEGSRMLQDAKSKRFDVILIYRLDRFGRSARIILNGVHTLEEMGIKVKSMTEPFDTGDPAGRFLLTILAGVADLERSNILDRLWHGANRAARDGKWLGGIVPYGYEVKDKYLVINETPLPGFGMSEAEVVRLIYKLSTENRMSTIKIADYLNALNLPPKYVITGTEITRGKRKCTTSGQWTSGRIRNMIVQTTYKGLHQYGKRSAKNREVIERDVPAIVTPEIWREAQAVLKENYIEALRSAKHEYLLRSLIKCGQCGLNFKGTYYKNREKAFYICNGKTPYRGKFHGKCPSTNIPAEWIEDIVWQDCVNFIEQPGKMIAACSENEEENLAASQDELHTIESSLKNKEAERHAIVTAFRKGFISESDLQKQIEEFDMEEAMLRNRLGEIKKSLKSVNKKKNQREEAIQTLESLQDKIINPISWEIKRDIIRSLVHEVRINTIKHPERDVPDVTVSVSLLLVKLVTCTDMDS